MVSETCIWIGDLASNCSYGLVSSFLLLYLSDVMGLKTTSSEPYGWVSKVFDGVTDVFFGNMIDKTKSRLGKARPWMLYAQIGVSLCWYYFFQSRIWDKLRNMHISLHFIPV